MNERIRELMDKAMVKSANMSSPNRKELDPGKFAELIVKECVGICDRVEDEYLNNEQLPSNEKYAIGAGVCRNTLYKHFGVE